MAKQERLLRVPRDPKVPGECTACGQCLASVGNGESVRPLRQRSERMKRKGKHYTAEEKVAILRRHLLDKVPVSDLCEELARIEADGVLPLAKRVLRERSGRLPNDGTSSPPGGGETETD